MQGRTRSFERKAWTQAQYFLSIAQYFPSAVHEGGSQAPWLCRLKNQWSLEYPLEERGSLLVSDNFWVVEWREVSFVICMPSSSAIRFLASASSDCANSKRSRNRSITCCSEDSIRPDSIGSYVDSLLAMSSLSPPKTVFHLCVRVGSPSSPSCTSSSDIRFRFEATIFFK